MRLKLAFASALSIASAPAFAHNDHGFQFPDLLHIVTNSDHLAIAAGAVLLMVVIGGLVFKRSGK
ncbi:MAG: hypothetical protein ACRCT6_07015 [Notoacmeibacter sp.]